jgi:hypothetical protein
MTEAELQALKPGDVLGYDGIVQVIENDVANRRLEVALVRASTGKFDYANLTEATKITPSAAIEEEV